MKHWKICVIVALVCATAFFAWSAFMLNRKNREQSEQIAELTDQLNTQKTWNENLAGDNKALRAENKQLQTELEDLAGDAVYIVFDSRVYHKDRNCNLILSLYDPVPESESNVLLRGYEPCFGCCRKK